MNNERKALVWGIGINAFSAIIGFVFYGLTRSQSLFLDSLISFILVISTVISLFISRNKRKGESEDYPLGRWAIENLFLIFRAILMLVIIVYTITEGIMTITRFLQGTLVDDLNVSAPYLVTYAALMVSACLMITFVYSYFNKKSERPSPIIALEIKASIYDGLVTLCATGGLLLFYHVPLLEPVKEIGDSIIVILLSLFYAVTPIKELIHQIRILSDRRRFPQKEEELKGILASFSPDFTVTDLYYSFSGQSKTIYVTLYPKENLTRDQIRIAFDKIRNVLKEKEKDTKVFLILSEERIHSL